MPGFSTGAYLAKGKTHYRPRPRVPISKRFGMLRQAATDPWRARSAAVAVLFDVDQTAARRLEVEGQATQLGQCGADLLMAGFGCVQQEEPPSAGAQNLAPDGSMRASGLVPSIQRWRGDTVGQPSFLLPVGVQQLAETVQLAAVQGIAQLFGERCHVAQPVSGRIAVGAITGLLFEDALGAARSARVEQQQTALEPSPGGRLTHDLVDEHAAVRIEAQVLQAAIRGDVLVLFADRPPAAVDLDRARLARQALGAGQPPGVGIEGVQQADGIRAGGTQSGPARGNIGDRGDLDGGIDPGGVQRLADELVLELVDPVDRLGLRITCPDTTVELGIDRDVDVPV